MSPHVFCPPSPVNGQPSAIPNPCLPLHKQAKSAIPMEFVSGRWSVVLFSCLQMSSDNSPSGDAPTLRFPVSPVRLGAPFPRFSVSPCRRFPVSPHLGPRRPVSPVPRFSVSPLHVSRFTFHSVPLSLRMSKLRKATTSPLTSAIANRQLAIRSIKPQRPPLHGVESMGEPDGGGHECPDTPFPLNSLLDEQKHKLQ